MPFGIYIHIPFCSRRCDYCDFATWVGREALVEEYVETILRQFKFQMEYFNIEPSTLVDSIFFGGGTPNLIDESHLAKIISTISSKLSVSSDTEITVECNPDHVTSGQMETYKHAGVNRISIGVQSSNHKVLEYLGREHNPIHVKTARDHIASSGITNVSADLIYGSPCESFKEWEDSLDFTIGLDLNHISAYALGIESGTPLANSITAGEKQTSSDDDQATKYEIADQVLNANGFSWYEISNWSKKSQRSKHNLIYWRGGNILALGCASHGVQDGLRYSTPRSIDKYLEELSPQRKLSDLDSSYIINQNVTSSIGSKEEEFALKLRTRDGIKWPNNFQSEVLEQFIDDGFVLKEPANETIYLNLKGRLMANRLTVDLFEEYSKLSSGVE